MSMRKGIREDFVNEDGTKAINETKIIILERDKGNLKELILIEVTSGKTIEGITLLPCHLTIEEIKLVNGKKNQSLRL